MRPVLLALLIVPVAAMAKDRIDPSSYTLTAVVDSAFKMSDLGARAREEAPGSQTEKHPGTGDPRCFNPTVLMTDPKAREFCDATSVPYTNPMVRLEVTVGSTRYVLHGTTMLAPKTYKARLLGKPGKPNAIEFLVADDKGNATAVKFKIIAVLKSSTRNPFSNCSSGPEKPKGLQF